MPTHDQDHSPEPQPEESASQADEGQVVFDAANNRFIFPPGTFRMRQTLDFTPAGLREIAKAPHTFFIKQPPFAAPSKTQQEGV